MRAKAVSGLLLGLCLLSACASTSSQPDSHSGMSVQQVVAAETPLLANLRSLVSAASPAGDWTASTVGGDIIACADEDSDQSNDTAKSNGATYAAKPLNESEWLVALAAAGALLSAEGYSEPTVNSLDGTSSAEYLDGGGNMILLVNTHENLSVHFITGCYPLYGSNS